MASIIQVAGKWRAQVRRKGHPPQTRTFTTKVLAQRWATQVENDIDRGEFKDRRDLSTVTVGDLLDRYEREITYIGSAKKECFKRLRAGLGDEMIGTVSGERLVRYSQERGVEPATWGMELGYLGTVLKVARAVWKIPLIGDPVGDAREAVKMMGISTRPVERKRRPTATELKQLRDFFAAKARQKVPMPDMIDFAIATAMRLGEITSLLWSDVDEEKKTVLIRDRKDPKQKKGNDQWVPLLPAAWEIVQRQPKTKPRIFPFDAATVSSIFPRACNELGIIDLRFHDLRHEGTSRLFEMGYQIQEVSIFTGHKSWVQLKRYTQIKPESLHR